MQLTDYQRDILIRTALGEARGEGVEGMADVIQTIFNRAGDPRFPSDPAVVALQPGEYSTWNKGAGGNNPQQFSQNSEIYQSAAQALDMVLNGRPDYTGGAIFYKTPEAESRFHDKQNKFGVIERHGHVYYPTHPTPAGEIPNVVASLTDTRMPSRPPIPETISPDLAQMRDPRMSPTARAAQVTPSPNVPLPRPRPAATDMVQQSFARLPSLPQRSALADSIARNPIPGGDQQSPIFDAAYDTRLGAMRLMVEPARTAGIAFGASPAPAPMPAQQSPQLAATRARDQELQAALNARYPTRLPELPPSTIGQPPTTRVVQSVPVNTPAPPQVSSADNIALQRGEQRIQRTPPALPNQAQLAAATGFRVPQAAEFQPGLPQPDRLAANVFPQAPRLPGLPQVGTELAVVPAPIAPIPMAASARPGPLPLRTAMAPMPMPASMRPFAGIAPMRAPTPMPIGRVSRPAAPLRIVVQGGNYAPASTPTQRLQVAGLSPSDAYVVANARAAQQAREGASRPEHVSTNSWFNEVTGRA